MSRDHRKLRAFQQADTLVLSVYQTTVDMPIAERFGLQAQIRRAAVSCATNIVEGSARASEVEYCRFLDIAFGSAREIAYLLDLSSRLGMLRDGPTSELVAGYEGLQAMLLTLVRRLRPGHH
jgi:four helix bundle protein